MSERPKLAEVPNFDESTNHQQRETLIDFYHFVSKELPHGTRREDSVSRNEDFYQLTVPAHEDSQTGLDQPVQVLIYGKRDNTVQLGVWFSENEVWQSDIPPDKVLFINEIGEVFAGAIASKTESMRFAEDNTLLGGYLPEELAYTIVQQIRSYRGQAPEVLREAFTDFFNRVSEEMPYGIQYTQTGEDIVFPVNIDGQQFTAIISGVDENSFDRVVVYIFPKATNERKRILYVDAKGRVALTDAVEQEELADVDSDFLSQYPPKEIASFVVYHINAFLQDLQPGHVQPRTLEEPSVKEEWDGFRDMQNVDRSDITVEQRNDLISFYTFAAQQSHDQFVGNEDFRSVVIGDRTFAACLMVPAPENYTAIVLYNPTTHEEITKLYLDQQGIVINEFADQRSSDPDFQGVSNAKIAHAVVQQFQTYRRENVH